MHLAQGCPVLSPWSLSVPLSAAVTHTTLTPLALMSTCLGVRVTATYSLPRDHITYKSFSQSTISSFFSFQTHFLSTYYQHIKDIVLGLRYKDK